MIGKLFKHFKGNIYKVIAIAKNSETLEDMVVYQSVETGDIWVRPMSIWEDTVIRDGKSYKRFTYIENIDKK